MPNKEWIDNNPAAGLAVTAVSALEPSATLDEDLRKIYTAPLMTSPKPAAIPSFWMLVLLAFHGSRPGANVRSPSRTKSSAREKNGSPASAPSRDNGAYRTLLRRARVGRGPCSRCATCPPLDCIEAVFLDWVAPNTAW